MSNKEEVAQTTKEEVSNPSSGGILEEFAGAGLENISPDQIQIPRLKLLQSQSGEVKKSDPDHIKGAEEGDFLDTVGRRVYKGDAGIKLSIFGYRYVYVEWEDKEDGSGNLIQNHGTDPTAFNESEQRIGRGFRTIDVEGEKVNTVIIPTFDYYITIYEEDGNFYDAVMSLSKTSAKVAKRLNTMINQTTAVNNAGRRVKAPIFWRQFILKSKPEANDENAWMIFDFERVVDAYGKPVNLIDEEDGLLTLQELGEKHKQFQKMAFVTEDEAPEPAPAASTTSDENAPM